MFGFRKKKKEPEPEFDEESDINPKDIIDEEQIEENPEEQVAPEEQTFQQPVKQAIQQPARVSKPIPKQSTGSLTKEVSTKEEITEEDVVNHLSALTSQIQQQSEIIRILMQRSEIVEERIRSLESSIFRIKNS